MPIIKSLLKYGHDNFALLILEYIDSEDISERETYWITKSSPYYNVLKKAYSSIPLSRCPAVPSLSQRQPRLPSLHTPTHLPTYPPTHLPTKGGRGSGVGGRGSGVGGKGGRGSAVGGRGRGGRASLPLAALAKGRRSGWGRI